MKQKLQVSSYVHIVLTVMIVIILTCYATKGRVRRTTSTVSSELKSYVDCYVDTKFSPLEKRVSKTEKEIADQGKVLTAYVNTKFDSLEKRVEKNVAEIKNDILELGKKIATNRKHAETQGKKANDLAETIFRAAYGADWEKVGKAAWNDYVVNPTQERWNAMAARLNSAQIAKILEIDQLQKRISELEKEKMAVKATASKKK